MRISGSAVSAATSPASTRWEMAPCFSLTMISKSASCFSPRDRLNPERADGSRPGDKDFAELVGPRLEIVDKGGALAEVDFFARRVAIRQSLAGGVVADVLIHLLSNLGEEEVDHQHRRVR